MSPTRVFHSFYKTDLSEGPLTRGNCFQYGCQRIRAGRSGLSFSSYCCFQIEGRKAFRVEPGKGNINLVGKFRLSKV